jgi:nitrogen regulatory protein P-II 2
VQTVSRQLVTIVAEPVVEHRLVDDIKQCGAKGYSLGHVAGEGSTGNRSLDLTGPSIRLETVVTDRVAEAIMDLLAAKYFDRYAVVAWMSPVYVARPARF